MAFLSKIGNMLRQTSTTQVNAQLSSSRPGLFQVFRCMSNSPSSKVFVGGISFQTDDQGLREAFSQYGEVVEARVIVDRETGRSRGFGFVTYTSTDDASSAIQALDGQVLHGRQVRVNYAAERPPRNYGGGGYGDGGGYGSGGGGYGGGGYGGGNYGGGGGYNRNAGPASGNYDGGFDQSAASNFDSGSFNVGGGGGIGNVASGGPAGYGSQTMGFDGGDQLGSAEDGLKGEGEAFDSNEPVNGSLRDDDDDSSSDLAKRP
ncbi:glycine-rich RNA-binding protein 2, mitochondrial-like isoform X2 [Hibiscus syriacus]|uniref:glycine-rich RNA-binding protein 2, mitochondrial-like isoform X2 n=1 Tax=Hibiscus syriacus TaxID=106335 RepID=UPI001924B78B|nr:glycine-rich RNA-binding protein 2, mitochondrial-like isoform X2 [Hibiscus syriacus]